VPMALTKTERAPEHPTGQVASRGVGGGGPSLHRVADSTVHHCDEIVEHAWLLKSELRWVRDTHNPLNALRWFAWDRLGVGHPPSRTQRVAADEVPTVKADSGPILSNRWRLRAA